MAVERSGIGLEAAYRHCRQVTKARATNFYYAFASLPGEKRNAIYAAYAFAGLVDDVVDGSGNEAERRRGLDDARALLAAAYDGSNDDNGSRAAALGDGSGALELALGDAVQRFSIPVEHFDNLVAGMEQDITTTRYATYAEVEAYCYRAASVIGLICAEIFGYDVARRDLAVEAAIDLGKALQLTNILRDVGEDLDRDRIYFAQEDLEACGYSEAELQQRIYNPAFRRLMTLYAERATANYESGLRLIPLLDGARSRMCCNGLQGVYRSILDEIVKRDYDVFAERVSPSKAGRLVLLLRLWVNGAWPRRRAL